MNDYVPPDRAEFIVVMVLVVLAFSIGGYVVMQGQ
jgi:hypothetical protein